MTEEGGKLGKFLDILVYGRNCVSGEVAMRTLKCPVCGRVVKESEMSVGDLNGCDCEYCVKDENGEPVYLRVYNKWVEN